MNANVLHTRRLISAVVLLLVALFLTSFVSAQGQAGEPLQTLIPGDISDTTAVLPTLTAIAVTATSTILPETTTVTSLAQQEADISAPTSTPTLAVTSTTIAATTTTQAEQYRLYLPLVVGRDQLIEIDFTTIFEVPIKFRASIQQAVQNDESILPIRKFTVSSMRYTDEWFYSTLVPSIVIETGWETLDVNEIVEILGYYNDNEQWVATIFGSISFMELATQVSPDFMDLSDMSEPLLASSLNFLFPWTDGHQWYKTQGWHQSLYNSLDFNAMDFQPVRRLNPASDYAVLAAEGGRLESLCTDSADQSWLKIVHPNGQSTVYGHLQWSTVRRDLLGKQIPRGQFLGLLFVNGSFGNGYNTGCGSGTAAHLHFVFPARSISINGHWANDVASSVNNTTYTSSNKRIDSVTSPNQPTQTAPTNGSITTNRTITLSWNNGGDANSRDFYAEVWKSDNSWKTQRNWNTTTSWNVAVPGPGTYQWRVKARNSSAESTWSSTWSFNVTSPLPPETSCLKPLLRYWNEARQKHYYTADRTNLGIGRNGWVYETFEGYVAASADCYAPGATPLYQLWHADFQKHFYTTSASEAASVVENRGYTRQADVGYVLPAANSQYQTLPLYRLYKHAIRDHFYTTSSSEKDDAVKQNYVLDWVDGYLFSPDALRPPETACLKPLLRYWNSEKKKHFYTSAWSELGVLKNNWVYERFEGYVAATSDCYIPGAQPLYRLWSDSSQKHFYTASLDEANRAVAQSGFKRERDVGYILRDADSRYHTAPLYQLYKASTKDHFYTITATERDSAVSVSQYEHEGIAAYVFGSKALTSPPPATPTATRTHTPQPAATATHTPQPTATRTHTPQPTATRTFTPQPAATRTFTPLPRATATATIDTNPVPTPGTSTRQRVYLPLIIR